MKLVIIENHQPLPVKQYGGIERISLFHYTAQCELGVNDPVLICLHGSSISTQNGKVIQLSRKEMDDLLSNKLPLRNLISDADIVLTNNSELFFPIDLSGTNTKRVGVCHGDDEITNNKYQFFVSNGQLKAHIKRKQNFDTLHKKVFVVNNGIDHNLYRVGETTKNKIVWFSSIDPRKSPELLGIIANSINENIIAAGTGNPYLFNSNKVNYIGPITGEEEKTNFFSRAEVYIHTSKDPNFNDPCPTTVLESQMCGVPVVGFKSGGVEEICYDKNLIFDNIEDLINCIKNKDYLQHKPSDIREWAIENFNSIKMAKEYNKCFELIMKD